MADQTSKTPYRVLFVCTGNTCRSPMAQGILRKLVADHGADGPPIEVASAGTMGLVGMPAAELAVSVAAEYGVDIRDHVSQAASQEVVNGADLVLAMASDHYEYCREYGLPENRLFLLRDFPQHSSNSRHLSIPDPIGQDRQVYQRIFFQIEEALRRSFPDIVARAREAARCPDRP